MRRSWIACGLALLAGCSRDLSVPSERTLAVAPTFAPAAPRERVALTATGGVAPYTAGFAQGGRLSGGDATVVPAGPPGTFAYHAGSLGSAQDLVEVRDASGAAVTMRVSVGPRLRVTPTLAVTAPGGQVAVVASGGLKPYTFTLEDAQPGTTLTPGPGADEYVITVGTLGDRAERAVLRDATFEPAFPGSSASAEAIVQVSGGVRLYANAPSVVPPFETVDFLAVGGLPPYTFGFAGGAAPSGGVIDPVSGRYVAGALGAADGSVWDGIVATDALGQVSASWPIAVGAPLRLELPATGLSPGIPQQLVASGGKPPYTFGFAARGNRSAGNVNAASGIYTPGSNQGTADLLAVWDATGVGSFVLSEPLTVGFSEIGDWRGDRPGHRGAAARRPPTGQRRPPARRPAHALRRRPLGGAHRGLHAAGPAAVARERKRGAAQRADLRRRPRRRRARRGGRPRPGRARRARAGPLREPHAGARRGPRDSRGRRAARCRPPPSRSTRGRAAPASGRARGPPGRSSPARRRAAASTASSSRGARSRAGPAISSRPRRPRSSRPPPGSPPATSTATARWIPRG